MATSDVGARR